MSPQVKADGQLCHGENDFCRKHISFPSARFYPHHPSPCISVRLIIWMGIQWTTLIMTEGDERGHKQLHWGEGKEGEADGTEKRVEKTGGWRSEKLTTERNRKREDKKGWTHKIKACQTGKERHSLGGRVFFFSGEGLWARKSATSSQSLTDILLFINMSRELVESWDNSQLKCEDSCYTNLSPSNFDFTPLIRYCFWWGVGGYRVWLMIFIFNPRICTDDPALYTANETPTTFCRKRNCRADCFSPKYLIL